MNNIDLLTTKGDSFKTLTGGPNGIAVISDAVAVEILGNEDDGITGFTSLTDYLTGTI